MFAEPPEEQAVQVNSQQSEKAGEEQE